MTAPMTAERFEKLMATPVDGPDGNAIDPRVARVRVMLRERVAQATEEAYRELRRLGVDDPPGA